MSVADELLANNDRYARDFTGPLPTGIKPPWAAEAFPAGKLAEVN